MAMHNVSPVREQLRAEILATLAARWSADDHGRDLSALPQRR